MAKTDDKELLATARERFRRAYDAELHMRQRWRDDWRFGVLGDEHQWDERALQARKLAGRPALTVNKISQHVRQVVNDIRQNRPAIKVLPVDDVADPDTAEIMTGMCRHIYHSSDGEIATDTAAEHAIVSGWGYFRILTEATKDGGLLDIVFRRVANALSVRLDPDAEDPTGSDAQWGFITRAFGREEAKRKFGLKDKDFRSWEAGGEEWECWHDDDSIVVAEYYYKDDDGAWQWCKMVADRVIERTPWPGSMIPIIRIIGNESHINGERDYWGMVRPARGSQQLYNLWVTAEAEIVSLMPKAPYLMPEGADEGYENEWASANSDNLAVIHYKGIDANGNPVSPPQRVQPPMPPAGIIQAKLGASDDIKAVMGQYDASLGQRSNETSGKAIVARQREGDTSTYHYIDNVARGMRQAGRIIIDLVPHVYDVARIARIMGEDGTVDMVPVDPSMQMAMQKSQDSTGKIRRAINPGVGRYDVMVVTGPSFTTKRQEGAEWMTQAMQGNPQLMQIMGDLYFRSLDVPYADDIAKRMKAMLPPQIAQMEQQEGSGIPPQAAAQMQGMQQQMQMMQAQLQQAMTALQDAQQQAKSKDGELQIKAAELQLKAREVSVKEAETQIKAQELELKAAEIQGDQAIEMAKLQADATTRAMQCATQQDAPESGVERTETESGGDDMPQRDPEIVAALASLAQQTQAIEQTLQQVVETISAPKLIDRDASGRAVAVGGRAIVRDENGTLLGVE